MINLYLIRHGETDLNKKGLFQGSIDTELNETGIYQSKKIVEKFRDIHLDIIFSSPLIRAYMTALFLGNSKKLKVHKVEKLKEIDFGLWEAMYFEEISKTYPNEWKKWCDDWPNYSAKNGESFKTFFRRVSDTMNKLLESCRGKKIAVVSHDGVMKVIISYLLEMNDSGFCKFYFDHGKYSLLEIWDNNCILKKLNV